MLPLEISMTENQTENVQYLSVIFPREKFRYYF
jgi:hypothetical protein